MHPRRKSAARWDNKDQGKSVGICLPKPDVMQDQVLICTGQSQDRRRGSTQNCRMREEAHITRLPPTTTTYFQVQCRCGISLPLIPITRLPPAMTRCTKTTKYARGYSTSQTIIFMTTETSDHATKCSMNQNSRQGGIYRPKKRCTWTKSTNGTNLTKDTVKRQN